MGKCERQGSLKSWLIAIKPSGVSYETMIPGDLVVIDKRGRVVGRSL